MLCYRIEPLCYHTMYVCVCSDADTVKLKIELQCGDLKVCVLIEVYVC